MIFAAIILTISNTVLFRRVVFFSGAALIIASREHTSLLIHCTDDVDEWCVALAMHFTTSV